MSIKTKRWLTFLLLLAMLVFAAFLWYRPLLSIGGGYAAKHACSCHFLQGRELAEISEHDLNFSVLGNYGLEINKDTVSATLLGLIRRKAVYTGTRGCILLNDEQRGLPPSPLDASSGGGALDVSLRYPGADAGAMNTSDEQRPPAPSPYDDALDFGMQPVPGGGARGIVILKDGELVAERYAPGYDKDTPLLGWSMTKTLTGMAVGALVGRDLRSLARPPRDSINTPVANPSSDDGSSATVGRRALFPEVWKDKRSEISLADLLHMNSGLAWNEGYGALTDATVMLHERPDFADFALRSQVVEEPGTVWTYSSGTTNVLMEYLRRELGDNQALYAFLDTLFAPAAPSLLIEPDQSGRPVGSSYGWATARDWARLGQFMLQDGVWQGDTLLPPGWIDFMREPAEGSDGGYGGHLWLPGPDMPSLPADAYMMRGFQDQRVFIIPSWNMVIARLGHGEDKVTDFDGLVRRILAADE